MNLSSYFPYYKRLLTLAVPVVLTQAGQMVVHLVDNAMVGRVGTIELAASSFASGVFSIIMVFGMGIIFGMTPLIGKALGAKNDSEASMFMKNGLVMTSGVMVFLFIIAWSASYLMPFLGQEKEVLDYAIPYYRLLVWSLLPFLMFLYFKQIGEGMGNTVVAMIATITSNLVNVFLNYLLIFGKWGFPELGLNGAGIATLISRIIMPGILYFGLWLVPRYRYYFKLFSTVKVTFHTIIQLLKTGIPIALQMVLEVSLFAVGAVMMGWIDDVSLAAHQIALGIAGFTFMIANGVAMATTVRVSVQLGNKNPEGLKMASYASIHLVLVYMLFTATGFFLLRYQLPHIFTSDPAVIQQAATLLIVAAVFQIFDGLQVVSLGILRGIADVKVPMYIATLTYLVIGLPLSYICAFWLGFGPMGIWFGFVAGLGLTGILLFIRIQHMWKHMFS